MTGFYCFMAVMVAVTIIVLLGFFGPESSDRPFWKGLRSVRAVLDRISYWIICGIAVGCLALAAGGIILKLFS